MSINKKLVKSLIERNPDGLYKYELVTLAKACKEKDLTGELKPIKQGMSAKDMIVFLKTGKKRFSNKKFDNLVKKGKELLGIPKDQEYSNRIKRSVMYLNASRYNKPPFDALRMINKNTSSKKPI